MCLYRALFLHSIVLCSPPAFAADRAVTPSTITDPITVASTSAPAPTLCSKPEEVVFSCQFKNGKVVSLCGSPDLSRDAGTLQYRFGRTGQEPELSYPQPAGHPAIHFSLDSSHGGRWAQHDLSFSTQSFRYALLVQTNSAISEAGASIGVFRGRHHLADLECPLDSSTNNMWLLDALGIPQHQETHPLSVQPPKLHRF
jgi:hypothetical protein